MTHLIKRLGVASALLLSLLVTTHMGFTQHYGNSSQNNYFLSAVEVRIRPVGMYMQYELEMDAHAGRFLYHERAYQMAMKLQLPAHSFITEASYRKEDQMESAKLLSRLGPIQTENESEWSYFRLIKLDSTNYYLTMYPFEISEHQRVRITYLAPVNLDGGKATVNLPMQLFRDSYLSINQINIHLEQNDVWKVTNESKDFLGINSQYAHSTIDSHISLRNFSTQIQYKNMSDGPTMLVSNEKENFYQLHLNPASLIKDQLPNQKICFLIDINAINTSELTTEFMSTFRNLMLNHFTPKDSINVAYSSLKTSMEFDSWIPATPENINQAFSDDKATFYNNTLELLKTGIDFMKLPQSNGKIVLITNNTGLNEPNEAIVESIASYNQQNTSIDIIDIAQRAYHRNVYNTIFHINSGYNFSKITEANHGTYYQMLSEEAYYLSVEEIESKFNSSFLSLRFLPVSNLQIECMNKNTKTYGNYQLVSGFKNSLHSNESVTQLGKFTGKTPKLFNVSFELNSNKYEMQFEPSLISEDATSLLPFIWHGLEIEELEKSNIDHYINYAIEQELNHHILGYYTAFMDASITQPTCIECELFDIEETPQNNTLSFYPTPFTEDILIDFSQIVTPIVSLSIYDIKGCCIRRFAPLHNERTLHWDGYGRNNQPVKPGIYIVVAEFESFQKVARIVKL